jgi:hypothetical protein
VYVESHERVFFIDSDEAATTAGRVKATFAAQDAWLTRTIEEIDRDVLDTGVARHAAAWVAVELH